MTSKIGDGARIPIDGRNRIDDHSIGAESFKDSLISVAGRAQSDGSCAKRRAQDCGGRGCGSLVGAVGTDLNTRLEKGHPTTKSIGADAIDIPAQTHRAVERSHAGKAIANGKLQRARPRDGPLQIQHAAHKIRIDHRTGAIDLKRDPARNIDSPRHRRRVDALVSECSAGGDEQIASQRHLPGKT